MWDLTQEVESIIIIQEKLKNHLNFLKRIEFYVEPELSSTVYQILKDQNQPIVEQRITSTHIDIFSRQKIFTAARY